MKNIDTSLAKVSLTVAEDEALENFLKYIRSNRTSDLKVQLPEAMISNPELLQKAAQEIISLPRLDALQLSGDLSQASEQSLETFVKTLVESFKFRSIDFSECYLLNCKSPVLKKLINSLQKLPGYNYQQLFPWLTYKWPSHFKDDAEKKFIIAEHMLFCKNMQQGYSYYSLPFKLPPKQVLAILDALLSQDFKQEHAYSIASRFDNFVGKLETWCEPILSVKNIYYILNKRLEKYETHIDFQDYFKYFSDKQILLAAKSIVKNYPELGQGLDYLASSPEKAQKFKDTILELRLAYTDLARYPLQLNHYQLTFDEVKALFPKYPIFRSIEGIYFLQKPTLSTQLIEGAKPDIALLQSQRTPIPCLLKCAENNSVWLYAKQSSGEIAASCLSEFIETSMFDSLFSANNRIQAECKKDSECYTTLNKLLKSNGGPLDLILDTFTELERAELLDLCLEYCELGNSSYNIQVENFNLPFEIVMSIFEKHSDRQTIIDQYFSDLITKSGVNLPYDSRLNLANHRMNFSPVFYSISNYNLEEEDRIAILKQAFTKSPRALTAIYAYDISDPQLRFDLFLSGVMQDPEIFEEIQSFKLHELKNIGAIFTVWHDYYTDDKEDYDEVDFILKTEMLPALAKIFDSLWPETPIFKQAFNYLSCYKVGNDFDCIKMLNMVQWLTYTALLFYSKLPNVQKQFADIQAPLKEIITYAEPKTRYALTSMLIEVCANQDSFEAYLQLMYLTSNKPKNVRPTPVRCALPALFVAAEIGKHPNLKEQESLVKQYRQQLLQKIHKQYGDGKYLRPCVAGFQHIFTSPELLIEHKIALAGEVFKLPKISMQIEQWRLAQGLALCGEMSMVAKNIESSHGNILQKSFDNALAKIFKLSPKAIEFYQQTFGTQYFSTSLLVYYGKMLQLPMRDQIKMLATLREYVAAVLSPEARDYYALRYDTSRNPHLKAIFDKCPWLKESWQRGASVKFDDFVKKHNIVPKPFKFNLTEFLIQKVLRHQHLHRKYSVLFREYVINKHKRNEIEAKLESEFQGFNDQADHLVKAACETPLRLIQAYKYSGDDPKIQAKLLRNIQKALPSGKEADEFNHDISAVCRKIDNANQKTKKMDTSGWRVIDTDHYWLMFMCGTFVESCQRVDGDPEYNKCLMGYPMNGDYRMHAIVDDQGRIIFARRIAHLVSDLCKVKPSLFIEEAYPSYLDSVQEQVLSLFARERAVDLGLTLTSLDYAKDAVPYGKPLIRQAGGAPYIYCDATFSQEKNGDFSIEHPQILYDQQLYALTHPVKLQDQRYPRVNFLQQAWQAGVISEITWQERAGQYQPVQVTFNPDRLTAAQKKQGIMLLQQYQGIVSSKWRVARQVAETTPKLLAIEDHTNSNSSKPSEKQYKDNSDVPVMKILG